MNNAELRAEIYRGGLHKLAASDLSRRLIELVGEEAEKSFGKDFRRAQFRLDSKEFFAKTVLVKKSVFESTAIADTAFALIESHGFALAENALEPPRVRFIEHDGHRNPAAAVAYKPHRDTWYANSCSQINWWIPLHDVSEEETFCFFPKLFDQPVANSSANFDFEVWNREVGFGRSHNSKSELYPLPLENLDNAESFQFKLAAGEVLLFSAAHLHQTLPNRSGLTRVSVDFRTVHLADHEQAAGAPNVDNQSRGSALSTYFRRAETYAGR